MFKNAVLMLKLMYTAQDMQVLEATRWLIARSAGQQLTIARAWPRKTIKATLPKLQGQGQEDTGFEGSMKIETSRVESDLDMAEL